MAQIEVLIVASESDYAKCLDIRRKVFIEEQNVPEDIEIDEFEQEAVHFLALVDGIPLGTGRLRLKKQYVKFERIATLKEARGSGVGKELMRIMQDYAHAHYPAYVPAMHAQTSAVGFYEKLGWQARGDIFYEAEIPHRLLLLPKKKS
jgi:predicted GNAT family N-acyltransferase